jgi:hypothetical protein
MQELINWLTKEIIDIECNINDYEERDLPVPANLYIILSKYKPMKKLLENYSEVATILEANMCHIESQIIEGFPTGNSYIGISNSDLERLSEIIYDKK